MLSLSSLASPSFAFLLLIVCLAVPFYVMFSVFRFFAHFLFSASYSASLFFPSEGRTCINKYKIAWRGRSLAEPSPELFANQRP